MINVGVIGYGLSAKTFHLPMYKALDTYNLTAISTSQLDAVRTEYPLVNSYDSANELIQQANVDLIVITAPNNVHYSLAMSCLKKGIHVVLEKPMTTTVEEAINLAKYAKEHDLVLAVFHNRRWDGDFLTVQKLIADKTIGEVTLVESHFDRFRPTVRQRWREQSGAGTGILFDLGSHLIDQALCLFGLPNSVTGQCLQQRKNAQTVDYFHVQLHYKNVEVILHSSSLSAGPNKRFYIEGTKGSFVKYGLDPQEDQLKAKMLPTELSYGKEKPEDFGVLYTEHNNQVIKTLTGQYQQFYIQLAQSIIKGLPSPVNLEDAVNVIKIITLAQKSSDQGVTLTLTK